MRSILLRALAALLIVGAASSAAWASYVLGREPAPVDLAAARSPRIVAVVERHDFGKVQQGADVVYRFKVRNEGSGELVIERAQGS